MRTIDVPGVRFRKPNADDIDWCKRLGLPVMHAKLLLDVTLRRVSDGVERTIVDDVGFPVDCEGDEAEADALEGADYQWRHGNYGCDCNRALFFARAADENEGEEECGHGRYLIVAPDWLAEV